MDITRTLMEDAEPNAAATHEAMGLFIEEFAATEAIMYVLLYHCAKVSFGVGRRIFANTSIEQIIEIMGRLVSINDFCDSRRSDLLAMLDQLKLINEARNGIVHFVTLSGIPGDARHLIDARRALTEKTSARFPRLCSPT